MTPAATANLLRARVPWVAGMAALDHDGHRWRVYLGHPPILCVHGIGHGGYIGGWEMMAAELGAVPDLTDRATFLLCVDELQRRGPGTLTRLWWSPSGWQDEPRRAELIEALARALGREP